MKKIIVVFFLLVIAGFGCQKFGGGSPRVHVPNGWTTYSDTTYDFSISYPDNMELRQRSSEIQDSTYAGLQGKFFLSLRDIEREEKPVTIATFYAFKDISVEKFSESLQASDKENITIKEIVDITQGGIAMKKMTNTTAVGIDKVHYLFQDSENLIVIGVILLEETAFAPVFETMQVLE